MRESGLISRSLAMVNDQVTVGVAHSRQDFAQRRQNDIVLAMLDSVNALWGDSGAPRDLASGQPPHLP